MKNLWIAFGVIVIDRIVKVATVAAFPLGGGVPLVGRLFCITYIRNTGAAFSLLQEHTGLLILLTVILILGAIFFLWIKRNRWPASIQASISMIIGGGIGNLIDRIAYGYVIDMFDLRHFAVFNVADVFVCIGCGLLILFVILGEGKHGSRANH